MKKRALNVLAACILLFSACSAGGENRPAPEPEDGVLVYAALNPLSSELEQSIERFNTEHTDVQIEVRDYSDEGGVQRLLVELAAGHVPDIMELHKIGRIKSNYDGFIRETSYSASKLDIDPQNSKNWSMYSTISEDYWMPYRQLAQKGYLEDLWPYIENDPNFGLDSVLEAPLKAAEIDGGLYMLFGEVSIATLMGSERVVGERYGWTFEELMDTFSRMPEGSSILRYDATKKDVFFNLISPALNQYVNWDTGECSYDSKGFRDTLLFLDQFPTELDSLLSAERIEEEVTWRVFGGQQMLETTTIHLLENITYHDAFWGGRAAFVGYPTADGSLGSFFILHGNKLAISVSCANKDAAWEFIRQLIQRSGYNMNSMREAHWMTWVQILINRKDYDLGNRVDMAQTPEDLPPLRTYKDGPSIPVDPPNEDDLQRLNALMDYTTQIYWPNDELSNIIWDAIGPYFAGDKTLDETVDLVQRRAMLYVNENR